MLVKHNKDFNHYSNPLFLACPIFYLFDIKSLIDKEKTDILIPQSTNQNISITISPKSPSTNLVNVDEIAKSKDKIITIFHENLIGGLIALGNVIFLDFLK